MPKYLIKTVNDRTQAEQDFVVRAENAAAAQRDVIGERTFNGFFVQGYRIRSCCEIPDSEPVNNQKPV